MSLLEWLGETFDPGDIGSVEMGNRWRRSRPRIIVLTCLFLSCVLLGLCLYAIWGLFGLQSPEEFGIAAAVMLAYLAIAYWVHPQPDTENLGWFGMFFDHPFRYSDDLNRLLLFLLIVLSPGRFVAESIVDSVQLVRHARDRA